MLVAVCELQDIKFSSAILCGGLSIVVSVLKWQNKLYNKLEFSYKTVINAVEGTTLYANVFACLSGKRRFKQNECTFLGSC